MSASKQQNGQTDIGVGQCSTSTKFFFLISNLIIELGLQGQVDMPGFVANPYSYFAKSDVFVLSSAWEEFGLVIVEALTVGTPVVSTDCLSGPREILQDGRLGRLVPVGDHESLADAIVATLDEPRRAVDPRDLEQFTQDAAVDAYLELLKNYSR